MPQRTYLGFILLARSIVSRGNAAQPVGMELLLYTTINHALLKVMSPFEDDVHR